MGPFRLYSYWRSSASYRVRIALNLKEIDYEIVPVHLVRDGGEQRKADFLEINPQGFVPVLADGQRIVRQSLAIMEYLDEMHPDRPLLPATARDRARVRGLAQMIACDTAPLGNLSVLQYLETELGLDEPRRHAWVRHWVARGLAAFELMLADSPSTGDYCDGEMPTMADCCLVPQVYNARRFDIEISQWPTIDRIVAACDELPAFADAHPDQQPDRPSVS